ncbi:MAG: hypothetical protein K6A38_06025 [Lachnospiraceae bacterium]|nr:hypothetical protein [Lachnospiraceae bacterium]
MDNKRKINIIASIAIMFLFFVPSYKIGLFGYEESYSAFKLLLGFEDIAEFLGLNKWIILLGIILIISPIIIVMINYLVKSHIGNGVTALVLAAINLFIWIRIGSLDGILFRKSFFHYITLAAYVVVIITSILTLLKGYSDSEKLIKEKMLHNQLISVNSVVGIILCLGVFVPCFGADTSIFEMVMWGEINTTTIILLVMLCMLVVLFNIIKLGRMSEALSIICSGTYLLIWGALGKEADKFIGFEFPYAIFLLLSSVSIVFSIAAIVAKRIIPNEETKASINLN